MQKAEGSSPQLSEETRPLSVFKDDGEKHKLFDALVARIDPAILDRFNQEIIEESHRIKRHSPTCGDCAERTRGICQHFHESVDRDEPVCRIFRRPETRIFGRRQ